MTQEGKRRFSLFPKALGDCVEPLVRPAFKEKGLAGSRIVSDWQKIVGEHLAAHTIPQKLTFSRGKQTGGCLTIAVESGFATELQHMQPLILERLAIYFGYQAIDRISISHTLAVKQQKKDAVKSPKISSPPPEELMRDIEATDDPELKEALKSFTETLYGKAT